MPARHKRPSRLPARLAVTTALGGLLLPALPGSASAAERQDSTVRISGPSGSVAPGSAPVSVRLLADGAWVRNGVVDVQIPEGSGWRTVARAATDERGLGRTSVRVSKDTRVRAHYRGSSVRTAATSGSVVIDVAAATGSRAVREAAKHRGKPYRYGATGPNAFDCSGFTQYVFRQVGKKLPRTSHEQERAARRVSKSAARPGDLIFIKDVRGHVGIYAGNGKMWDAPRSGKTVTLRSIWTSNYAVGRV